MHLEQPSRNIWRHISLIWPFPHSDRHSPWPVNVKELFPRFCCWTLIWLSRQWAWLHQGHWRYRSLIDWLLSLRFFIASQTPFIWLWWGVSSTSNMRLFVSISSIFSQVFLDFTLYLLISLDESGSKRTQFCRDGIQVVLLWKILCNILPAVGTVASSSLHHLIILFTSLLLIPYFVSAINKYTSYRTSPRLCFPHVILLIDNNS